MAKRTPVAPSFEDRHNAAVAVAESALSVFQMAIADLEAAATQQRAISDDIEAEVDRIYVQVQSLYDRIDYLRFVQNEADTAEAIHLAKADSIHALMGN